MRPFALPHGIQSIATSPPLQRLSLLVQRRPEAALFVLALLLRLVVTVVLDWQGAALNSGFASDAGREYASMARGLLTKGDFTLQGKGLWLYDVPSAYQPPLYPLLLAALFRLRGQPFPAALMDHPALIVTQLLQCVIGACWCLLLYRLGQRLYNNQIGAVAGMLGACYPAMVYTVVEVHPLNLFLLLLLIFLDALCTIIAEQRTTIGVAVRLGISAGLLALTRSECFLLCPLLMLMLALFYRRARSQAALAGLLFLMLYAPWLARNYRDFGGLVLTNTSGLNLYRGQGPTANGGTYAESGPSQWWTPELYARIMQLPPTRDWEKRQDALLREAALEYIRQHPSRPLRLAPRKLAFFLIRDPSHPKGRSPLVWLPGLLLLLCALRGMVLTRDRIRFWWPVAAVPAFYMLIVLIFFSLPRYRMMIDPVLMLPAACGLYPGYLQKENRKKES